MQSSDQSEQQTRVSLRVRGLFGDYRGTFEAAIGGGSGLEFKGHIEVNEQLGVFLEKSLHLTPADAKIFPDIPVPSPTFTYRSQTATLLIRLDFDTGITLGNEKLALAFAFGKLGGSETPNAGKPAKYIAGIRSTTPIRLGMLGGDIIGKLVGDVGISHLGVFYASDEIAEGLALFDGEKPQGYAKSFSFTARFGTSQSSTDIALPPPEPAQTGDGAEAGSVSTETPARSLQVEPGADDKRLRKWFKVQKTFGPLELRRIGGEWHEGKLGFLLDAGVELLGLKVGLAGLRVSVEPAKLAKLTVQDLEFGLDGLEIDFKGGPISISGAFLKTPDGAYSGMARISAQAFTITAIGSYATTTKGDPSLFIFGAFVGILGGPPCFVVEGVAAGFGYNRGLTVPKIEDVRDFPLVSLVLSPAPGGSTNMLEQLGGNHFPIVQGQYWIAAGIKFTSFKLIDAFALLTVQFGARFELALLGVATMQQPPKVVGAGAVLPKPFVYVELALSVRFAPDDGLLAVRAALTSNSYLFDTRCKLTGGFAFCIWFTPTNPAFEDHAGDFVLTFGGYHPRFNLPPHYPQVPRVGFNWQLPAQGVTIKGECYFALTPSCIMGGCRLLASYRSGDIAVWFEAHADFLMAWEPFHYEAEIGIWIGASFTLRLGEITCTISFQLGASLSIWGPEFAGEAHIDLGIVAFTVPIGAKDVPRTPPPVEWKEFRGKFIPHIDGKPAPLSIAITGGILREDKDKGVLIVSAAELSLIVDAYIPISKLQINNEPLEQGEKPPETKFGIRPLGEQNLTSELTVGFRKKQEVTPTPIQSRAITKGVPEALWSRQPAPAALGNQPIEAKVISNALSGVRLFVQEQKPANEATATPGVDAVSRETDKPGVDEAIHAKSDDRKTALERLGRMLIDDINVRTAAVTALKSLGFDLSPEAIDLRQTARCVRQADVLLAPPLFVALGELPPLRSDEQ